MANLIRSIAVTAMTEAEYGLQNAPAGRAGERRHLSRGVTVPWEWILPHRYFCTGDCPAADYAHYGLALQYYTHFTYGAREPGGFTPLGAY